MERKNISRPPLSINKAFIYKKFICIPVPPGSYAPPLALHCIPLMGAPHYLRNAVVMKPVSTRLLQLF